jgi:hypothetical protein
MTLFNTTAAAKPKTAAPLPRRSPRSGAPNVTPLVISVATLLAIAWVVSFQHQHSSLYDDAPRPDRPAASASANP